MHIQPESVKKFVDLIRLSSYEKPIILGGDWDRSVNGQNFWIPGVTVGIWQDRDVEMNSPIV